MVRELGICKKFCLFFFPDFKLYHDELVKCFKVLVGNGSVVAVHSSQNVQAKKSWGFFSSATSNRMVVKCFKVLVGKGSAVAVRFSKSVQSKKCLILQHYRYHCRDSLQHCVIATSAR